MARVVFGPENVQVAVVNHGLGRDALALRAAFAPHARAVALDSGSELTAEEAAAFDACLPNVFYGGLLNEAVARATGDPDDVLLFLCSDVGVADPAHLMARLCDAFAAPTAGVYAPSIPGRGQPSMRPRRSGGLRTVTFVEGACFAARLRLLRAMTPVDLRVNALGWGLDVQLGYAALVAGLRSVVDDDVAVTHPLSTGYSCAEAKRQRRAWLGTLSSAERAFHRIAGTFVAHTAWGTSAIAALPWRAGAPRVA